MRIAILTSYLYHKVEEFDNEDRVIYGGAESYLIQFCRMLQEDGHYVQVFQPFKPNYIDKEGNQKPTHTIQKDFYGIPVILIPTSSNWEYGTCPELNYTFNELTCSFQIRIYFVTFLAWPEVRRPAISISHGIYWDFANHFVKAANIEQKNEFYRRFLYGVTAPDACVAVDTNVRGVVAALSPGDENRIHVVPNFTDVKKFKPLEPEKRDWERPRVLYPRRLSTVRGVNDFLWLAAQFPEVDFICCGNSGPEKDQEEMLRQFTEGKSNIKAIWRRPENMVEVYQMADISIIPTRAAEGTSLSMLESMACGLPIIGSNAGGLPNLLIDNWNGIQVDMNHDKLADALHKLLKHPKLAAKMGRRGRQMAVNSFDISIWKRRWRALINRVVR
ncbi:MAG: Capsular glucan synthase [Pelotomaculum sp. PtaU1.Bin035]|nr:MAG: Capsular glucan synthase [Pelotomaculum sp. PtaU1.Bin035]